MRANQARPADRSHVVPDCSLLDDSARTLRRLGHRQLHSLIAEPRDGTTGMSWRDFLRTSSWRGFIGSAICRTAPAEIIA